MNIVVHGLWGAVKRLVSRGGRPYLAFFLIWIVFSYPFFFQGKIPAPLDFLVNFYAPWDAYYDAPIKNSALSDVVSQIIPWKIFNAEELKNGRIPVWNPYNLAGTPHLGSWQSGVFYPTTLLFLFLPITAAWSLHILLQPLLAGIFMILFLRSLHLSRISSLLGAVAFAYGGFMTTWLEWGTLGHALLWLPLALYGIERTKDEGRRTKILMLTVFALTLSLLAGHPQTSFYVFLTVFGYYLYRNWGNQSKRSLFLISCFLLLVPFLLSAPQVLPAIQVYLNSARTLVDGTSWAKAFLIPVSGLLTFLAPDFFGNPVTRNSWSNFSYVEMQGYVGIATLVLAIVAVSFPSLRGATRRGATRQSRGSSRSAYGGARDDAKFFLGLVTLGLLLATNNPISNWIINLKLPIISSSSPARLVGVVDFSLAVLAALGLERLMTMIKERKSIKVFYGSWLAAASGLAAMWIWAIFSGNNVSIRNLILPTVLMILTIVILSASTIFAKHGRSLFLVSCFLFLVIVDLFRFHHKFTHYSDISMWYPQLPVLAELGSRQERSFGLLDGNLNLPFRIYSLDGYDPMASAQYVKLTYPSEELVKRNRITGPYFPKGQPETIDLVGWLGGKWFVDSATPGGAQWDLKLWEYGDQFQQVWKDEKYQILLNTGAVDELVEPLGWMREQQYRLFLLGLAVSGITIIGSVILTPTLGRGEESRRDPSHSLRMTGLC